MKPQLNNTNKELFKHLYANQRIGLGLNNQLDHNGDFYKAQSAFTEKLQLKSTNLLCDEHAVELMYLLELKSWVDELENKVEWGKLTVEKFLTNHLTSETMIVTQDFLRLKGYAVSFIGLTVSEMVEAGWVLLLN